MTDDARIEAAARALQDKYREFWKGSWPDLETSVELFRAGLAAYLAAGDVAEPVGCPTPGACSCPAPSEAAEPVDYDKCFPGWRHKSRAALKAVHPAPSEAGRVAKLEAILNSVEHGLKNIYTGDKGPVLRNTVRAECARRWEVGVLLKKLIRSRAALKGGNAS